MRLRTILLTTLLLGLSAVPADAASRLTVRGAGFGHGVGMSQYGAMGYAKQGANYRDILAHYYTGTSLGTVAPNRVVRAGLLALRAAAEDAALQRGVAVQHLNDEQDTVQRGRLGEPSTRPVGRVVTAQTSRTDTAPASTPASRRCP